MLHGSVFPRVQQFIYSIHIIGTCTSLYIQLLLMNLAFLTKYLISRSDIAFVLNLS